MVSWCRNCHCSTVSPRAVFTPTIIHSETLPARSLTARSASYERRYCDGVLLLCQRQFCCANRRSVMCSIGAKLAAEPSHNRLPHPPPNPLINSQETRWESQWGGASRIAFNTIRRTIC
jgi:hypothetical protein